MQGFLASENFFAPVLAYLPPADLLASASVQKMWAEIAMRQPYWGERTRELIGPTLFLRGWNAPAPGLTWALAYKLLHVHILAPSVAEGSPQVPREQFDRALRVVAIMSTLFEQKKFIEEGTGEEGSCERCREDVHEVVAKKDRTDQPLAVFGDGQGALCPPRPLVGLAAEFPARGGCTRGAGSTGT